MSSEIADSVIWFFDANGLIFELLVSVALFSGGLTRRPAFAARATSAIVALTVVSSSWSAWVAPSMWSDIARFLLLLALTGGAIALCWRVGRQQAAFLLVMAAVMQHFAFRGAAIVTSLLTQVLGLDESAATVIYPLALVPFFVLGYFAFARQLRGEQTTAVGNRAVLLLLAGMLLSVNIFTNVFDALNPDGSGALFATFSLLDLITCVFLLSLTTQIVHRESAERNSEILAQLLHQQKSQLESSRETIELINVKTHDMKQQIALLGDRIPQDEVDELHRLVGIYDSMTQTGNEALDVLLAEKTLVAETRAIRFDRVVDGQLLAFMKPSEVYSLFGNAIDNAMDAVTDLADASRRYIALDVRKRKGMLAIHIENPYEGERIFVGGLPRTTKDDERHHGFGMRSIQMITERYEGFMSISTKHGIFALNVLIPLPRTP